MNKKLYVVMLALSVIMTVLTIIVSVQGTAGTQKSLFSSPFLVFVFAAFVAIQIICIINIKGKLTFYRISFYILHCGLVLMLVGMFCYYIWGDKINVNIVADGTTYSQISRASEDESTEKDILNLDFYMGISGFKIDRYDDGSDKHYEATLIIEQMGQSEPMRKKLTVNHPCTIKGYKIYLMGYDRNQDGVVSLMLKKNPGEYVTLAGIWMIVAGTFAMCLLKKREVK